MRICDKTYSRNPHGFPYGIRICSTNSYGEYEFRNETSEECLTMFCRRFSCCQMDSNNHPSTKDRNKRWISHWNLNGNYTKCYVVENTLGNNHKAKSIHTANRKSHRKLREKYQFCRNCTRCTAADDMQLLHWNLNDMLSP